MRRITLIFMLLVLFAAPVFTQNHFTFGPKIGFTSSHLTTDQDTVLDAFRQGFQGGAFARFYGDYLYFQPEVMYVTKGGIFNKETEEFKQDIDLQSIDIPVVVGLKLGPEEFHFRVHGGGVASFIIQKTVQLSGNALVQPLKEQNIKDSYFGAIVGMGLDILSFSIDVRYEFGWDNLYKNEPGVPPITWKQEMFNVSLAFKLL